MSEPEKLIELIPVDESGRGRGGRRGGRRGRGRGKAHEKEKNSETNEEVVVYEALYGKHLIWTRPYNMFNSLVDKEKYPDVEQTYRFELID